MVLKAEDWREDPYASIRRDIPRPGHVISSPKAYNRKRAQKEMEEILEESMEELKDLNVEIVV